MKRLLSFLILLLSQSAMAFVPAPGLWNTDAIDGQGFNIETQNDVMIVTAYVFDQSGNQIWYLAVGSYDETNSVFTGTLANAVGGSCLTCSYKPPTGKNGNAGGTLKIAFQSRENAVATINGGSARTITHFNYGYSGNNGYFFGKWQFSYQGFAGIVDAQWITFPGTTFIDSGGLTYASGVQDQYSGSIALARYSNGLYVVGVNDGLGYSRFYQFTGDNQHMLGLGYFNSTSSTPYIAQGSRIFTPHELTDPGSAISNPDSINQRYEQLSAAMRGMPVDN